MMSKDLSPWVLCLTGFFPTFSLHASSFPGDEPVPDAPSESLGSGRRPEPPEAGVRLGCSAAPRAAVVEGGSRARSPDASLNGSPRTVEAALEALPMIHAGSWASHVAASSLSGGVVPHGMEPGVRGVIEEAPAIEPLSGTGEFPHSSSASHGAEERPGHALELARGHSAVRHNLL